ncbi:hypothetical protein ACFQJD_18630 [Haloplanus sp. GCM10025708]|uniref:hypothetical protein n=1 Tax=Haloferacaceae TaxID=1644056 RepID=UPI003616D460
MSDDSPIPEELGRPFPEMPERFYEQDRFTISDDGRVWDDGDGGRQVWPPEETDDEVTVEDQRS